MKGEIRTNPRSAEAAIDEAYRTRVDTESALRHGEPGEGSCQYSVVVPSGSIGQYKQRSPLLSEPPSLSWLRAIIVIVNPQSPNSPFSKQCNRQSASSFIKTASSGSPIASLNLSPQQFPTQRSSVASQAARHHPSRDCPPS